MYCSMCQYIIVLCTCMHVSDMCTICIYNTYIQHVYIVYVLPVCVSTSLYYVHVCMSLTCVQCVCTIHIYSMCIQYMYCSMCQYIIVLCTCMHVSDMCTMCIYNTYIHTLYICIVITVNLEIFVYENFRSKNFRVDKFS